MSKGLIFNIQRYSIHDGPGIRTVVFFKGCPLHCPWCSNPESQSQQIQITWKSQLCTHCGECIRLCPTEAITRHNEDGNDILSISDELCIGCLRCVKACPSKALAFEGEYKEVHDILTEVIKDTAFYEESGGGMTLSGGEVLNQADFAVELLHLAKSHHIHTACETTCYTDSETFNRLINELDLLLCDIKHYDSSFHEHIVGVPLEPIFKNIRHAVLSGIEVIARIPVIPNFNFATSDALGLSEKLKELGITKVELLPFHQFGEKKYDLLQKTYLMKDVDAIRKDSPDFLAYSHIFTSAGLSVIES